MHDTRKLSWATLSSEMRLGLLPAFYLLRISN